MSMKQTRMRLGLGSRRDLGSRSPQFLNVCFEKNLCIYLSGTTKNSLVTKVTPHDNKGSLVELSIIIMTDSGDLLFVFCA